VLGLPPARSSASPPPPPPSSEENQTDGTSKLADLRALGAHVRPWSAPEVLAPGGIGCGVRDGVVMWRGPSGARWQRPVQVSTTFALRLATFEQLAQEQAHRFFGVAIARVEDYGSYVCRPIKGTAGSPSEHARGDAVDVAAFVLKNGRRITVARDFVRGGAIPSTPAGRFLRELTEQLRDRAVFGTVLTPDYDARHSNHLHLDGRRWWWFGEA
jgi:hypothetical protein